MEIVENIKKLLQEMIVPELNIIKAENGEIKAILQITTKRLDDVNIHLTDLSRRIDNVRDELTGRIDNVRDELTGRIDNVRDELTGRIDNVRDELTGRIDNVRDELTGRIDETNRRIDALREELTERIDETNNRIDDVKDSLSVRIDRLYEVIVRRDEHEELKMRITRVEHEVSEIKEKLAA